MKGSTEACSNAEVEIMKKLREAYENDVVAVNVSPRPAPRHPPASELLLRQPEKYVGGVGAQSVMERATTFAKNPQDPTQPSALLSVSLPL